MVGEFCSEQTVVQLRGETQSGEGPPGHRYRTGEIDRDQALVSGPDKVTLTPHLLPVIMAQISVSDSRSLQRGQKRTDLLLHRSGVDSLQVF